MSIVKEKLQPLYHGQRLTRDEFLRRWEAMPNLKSAELIGGVVYMPSPVSTEHGDKDFSFAGWQWVYAAHTPGVVGNSKSTWLMLDDSPQPESSLRILPECGGHSRPDGKYTAGAPEFINEVSLSSEHYDLHEKLELYERAGVDEYLVVLPSTREIRWHHLVNGTYQLIAPSPDGILRSVILPGLWLHPQALLQGDMALVFATLQQGLQSPEHAAFVQELERRRVGGKS
jgi:Uma2 family endonuclease